MDFENVLIKKNNRFEILGFPVLEMPMQGKNYFSINPFLPDSLNRCPLGCLYCLSQKDFWNKDYHIFNNKILPPNLIQTLVNYILDSKAGRKGFPIAVLDYSDPFLPIHQNRLLETIAALRHRNAVNIFYVTTKLHPGVNFLNKIKSSFLKSRLKPVVLVSLSPLQPGLEKVSVSDRVRLIKDLVKLKIPSCWYIRPLVQEWFYHEMLTDLVHDIAPCIKNNIIISSLIMTKSIEENLIANDIDVPVWDDTMNGEKLLLPETFEKNVRSQIINIGKKVGINIDSILSHRICAANRYLNFACKVCQPQDRRFCQGYIE